MNTATAALALIAVLLLALMAGGLTGPASPAPLDHAAPLSFTDYIPPKP